ncbi:response regulator [Streptomyces sp. NRRL F-4489]|uniref:response regulator n=1 Tax=Streptomyces sp. NRRL F-4489 TaxID=1609095 RepID=UPI00083279A6|nr:response regulator transcription factor [Streptomyces sp. NRRL F-4489]
MTSADGPIRVFVLDDHEMVRRGVSGLLNAEPDLTVVGEGATAAEALTRAPALRPDVAVLDVHLPDGDGVAVCRDLRAAAPGLACLMLTTYADDEVLLDALTAGACGFLLKQVRGPELVGAVREAAAGRSLLGPGAVAALMERLRTGRKPKRGLDAFPDLTERERQLLELIGEGLTNRQIGQRLFLAEKTVKNYVSRLFVKLGVERRAQAAVIAGQAAVLTSGGQGPGEGSGQDQGRRLLSPQAR